MLDKEIDEKDGENFFLNSSLATVTLPQINKENKKMYEKKAKPLTQKDKLKLNLIDYCKNSLSINEWTNDLENDLPKKYKLSQDIIILPSNCFLLPQWMKNNNRQEFYEIIAKTFNVERVAQENRVKSDDFRSPNLTLLYGTNPHVTVVNNNITYSYDITKCMFSWGNITEKLRIAEFDCSNEVVVDLYAGIGYFTLPYLIHSKAKKVIACEWNPASVDALKNNLILNKCEDRCQILEGDNRETCPQNIADRVNLGLIPSSESSWPTAVYALKDKGGYLHIHGNVDVNKNKEEPRSNTSKPEWIEWSKHAQREILRLLKTRPNESSKNWSVSIEHIEYVKSYGPRVDHLVLDLLCKPVDY